MQIGQASKASGVSAKMIRYYEAIGLVPGAERQNNSYRAYRIEDVHRLQFIRRARDLGFSVGQIRDLIRLLSDPGRRCADVQAIAISHLAELQGKVEQLRGMTAGLNRLVDRCEGDDRPDCPILDGLDNHSRPASGDVERDSSDHGGPIIVSATTSRGVTIIDGGDTLAVKLETGAGDEAFVLIPAEAAFDIGTQIATAAQQLLRTRAPRSSC